MARHRVPDDRRRQAPRRQARRLHNTGSVYDLIDSAKDKVLKPIGEWNHSRVVVKDGKIEHFLNGKPCATVDTKSDEWKAALAKSKFAKKVGFAPGKGKLMLTEHGDPCWYKNLTITDLDAK